MRKIIFSAAVMVGISAYSQVGYWPNDTAGKDMSVYAIKNITLYQDYKTKIDDAVLVFQDGKIIASGKVAVPKEAVVIDGKKSVVYPSFIDPYSNLGVEKSQPKDGAQKSIYMPKNMTIAAYNDAVKATTRAVENYTNTGEDYRDYLSQGFGAAMVYNQDGIVRGSGAVVALSNQPAANNVLKEDATFLLSFDKGTSSQSYPTSLAGSIALIRQAYLDADWYAKGGSEEKNSTLEYFNRFKNLPTFIETVDKWDILRADKIGDEAGRQFIFVGSGNEYQRAKEIKATNGAVILPLEYPKAYQVQDALDGDNLEVADLKHWELAPYNAVFLSREKVPYAFTMYRLKDKSSFLNKIRELNKKGISKEEILQSLTMKPAELLQMQNKLGTLTKGAFANFIMASEDIFSKDAAIYENWVKGKQYVVNKMPEQDVRGNYTLNLAGQSYDLTIKGQPTKPEAEIKKADKKGKAKVAVADYKMALELKLPEDSIQNYRIFYPIADFKSRNGMAVNKDGSEVPFSITYVKPLDPEQKKNQEEKVLEIGKIWYPFNAFGSETLPQQRDYLIRNATVWTNTSKGIAKNYDVRISKGKITQVGQNLPQNGLTVIDGTNMHLTNGILDEHTHIGLSRGVNEAGSNNSAEVRMADVINPDDINFYRQLAGGVTTAQQLHGSANPIGGQSSVVKFKWGENAENMKFPNNPKFIKFALGENVKQSNWGNSPNRFPQSRGGVEQAFDFWFTRAKEYEQEKKKNPNYRKDLRLETVLEILNRQREITCHSYVQSEINMLMNLADRMGFKVNTFTHILEGYKVADKMAAREINGSTFSDWWAYKEEVREAIPYNAALLMQAGVNTAINSDDAEMARRLNQEAGKLVKYGNVPQEEAWKAVTLNPAKILHLEKQLGTIEPGKDADLVLWTDNPLSIYAKVNKTFVDGTLYFDADTQAQKDKQVKDEKNRIIQKMLFSDDVKKGAGQPVSKQHPTLYHCDTLTEEEVQQTHQH